MQQETMAVLGESGVAKAKKLWTERQAMNAARKANANNPEAMRLPQKDLLYLGIVR